MARVVKKHDVRRTEIVLACLQLFQAEGYQAATITTILDRLGIARGTFYHYFSSKEEVLDAVVELVTQEAMRRLSPLVEDTSMPAIEKLNAVLLAMSHWRVENAHFLRNMAELIYRDENVLVRHKIDRRNCALFQPVLVQILEQGRREGSIHVAFLPETAEAIMSVTRTTAEKWARALLVSPPLTDIAALIRESARVTLDLFERLLGIPGGSLTVDGDLLDRLCQQLQRREADVAGKASMPATAKITTPEPNS
jgi:AcrR family transcriptional regulator